MLVLSRKVGEELVIGENVRVFVSRIEGNRVTLATHAPASVKIRRGEIAPLPKERPDETQDDAT